MTRLYQAIASKVDARLRCIKDCELEGFGHLREWIDKHQEAADELVEEYLPHGSGFDCGTKLDWDRSTGERLVFNTSFHHMDECGGYDGWTEHTVTVKASLVFGITMTVSGRDRNDIKDYIHEAFEYPLNYEVDNAGNIIQDEAA